MVAKYKDGTEYVDYFDTVIFTIGCDASKIGMDKVGVKLNPKNGKILHDEEEQTNVPNIYAVGNIFLMISLSGPPWFSSQASCWLAVACLRCLLSMSMSAPPSLPP